MNDTPVGLTAIDRGARSILRAGAVCGFAVVAGYLATVPLYAWVGAPPATGLEVQALEPLRIVNALLVTTWYVLAALGLLRLARG